MKIIAATRTRNEARNIDRFCRSYAWADRVLVADGGSEDDTITRAEKYPNVSVRAFTERIEHNGYWRNPHGKHINFLIDRARDEGADWLILSDTDNVPTLALQKQLRRIMETTNKPVIMAYLLYVWGDRQYFPDMNKPGQSLYAWRLTMPIRAWEGRPYSHRMMGWWPEDELRLERPLCCLHYSFPDEAEVQRKREFYVGVGERERVDHPLDVFGKLAELPEWARWE